MAQGLAGDYEALGVQEDGTVFQKTRVRKQPDKYLPIEEQSDLLPIEIAVFGLEFVVIDEPGHGPGGTLQIGISRNAGSDEIQA